MRQMFDSLWMKLTHTTPRKWPLAMSTLMWGITMNACATDTMKWKEEMVLHDGNKIIVTRSHTYDPRGFREIGQPPPLVESTITFTVPATKQTVTWKSDYGRGNQDNLDLLMLDFVNGVSYIAAHPKFCHGYNKWGRPNPPYVFFKYDKEWRQIPLAEFPMGFKKTNVSIDAYNDEKLKKAEQETGFVTANDVKELNKTLAEEYRAIFRSEIKTAYTACEELIYYKSGWISPKGTFGRDFMDKISK